MLNKIESLCIKASEDSPSIILNAEENSFIIEGRCIPEDGIGFFMPVISWFRRYEKSPNPSTILEFKLSYFNSASSKAMWELFSLLRKIKTDVVIKWHYSDQDDEMRDAGEEFASFFDLKFDYITHHEEADSDYDDLFL